MLAVRVFLTILALGITGAESPPDYTVCQQYTHDCVPFYQCLDGFINTSGVDLIDPRVRPRNRSRASRRRQRNRNRTTSKPTTRSLCFIANSNDPGVCCRIPDATTPATTTTTTALPYTCTGGRVCVDRRQCNVQGNIITDGAGLIDPRRISNCIVRESGSPGVCCSPPSQNLIDNCPGNADCVQSNQCKTNALNGNNNYVPYNQGGSWTHCRLGGQFSSQAGVCCQKPAPQYTAANECGVRHTSSPATRILLNKKDTIFGEFPWQAILFFKNYTFACGATLISQQWAITAAHCIKGYSNQYLVRLGETVVNEDKQPLPTKDIGVSQIIVHPNYASSNLHNDIALIKLSSSVPYQYHINRVCLPSETQTDPKVRCFASGWGKNAFEGTFQVALKKVDLPVVPHTNCQNMLRQTRLGYRFILDSSFVCAGGEIGKDVCKGDGGGPLVCQDPFTGRYFLYGITSWGIGCGNAGVPGVYVNVPKFSGWIWQHVK